MDMRTLIVVLGISDVLHLTAITLQYAMNRTYLGIGWWAVGSGLTVAAFALMLLRPLIPVESVAIIVQNTLLVSAVLVQYVGGMRFLEKRENRAAIWAIGVLFMTAQAWFTFAHNDLAARTAMVYVMMAAVSTVTGLGFLASTLRAVRLTAIFMAAIYLTSGVFFAVCALALIAGGSAAGYVTVIQPIVLLCAFVEGTLLTFGLIIMVNQRLHAGMREAKEHFELLFETGPDASVLTRMQDGCCVSVNEGFTALTGFSREETVGRSTLDLGLWNDSAQRQAVIDAVRQCGVCKNVEAEYRSKDGGRRIGMLSAKLITIRGEPHLLSVTRDITQLKHAEAERALLEIQNQQLQKSESLGRMAGAIAHHFNNQLCVVLGNLEMAKDELLEHASASELVAEATMAVRRAAEVSGQMLTYLGHATGARERLALADIVRPSLPMLRAAMSDGIVLEVELASPAPLIEAGVDQIQQIVISLVTNAREAYGDQPGRVRLSVHDVSPREIPIVGRFPVDWQPRAATYACLEVADAGSGIAAEDIGRLFDPFFSTKFTGRGLGLSVALGIVRAHAGAITVVSEPDQGSTFRVYLPAVDGPPEPGTGGRAH